MTQVMPLILSLDIAGNPRQWITYEDAAYYYAKEQIAWQMGQDGIVLHGGIQRSTGEQSTLDINSIIAVKGKVATACNRYNHVPLTNKALFRRDANLCAYCGRTFPTSKLTRDHVQPVSRKGPNTWTNVVAACGPCNKYKDCNTPSEAGMELLFVPYQPNRSEYLILMNRGILADQMEFLMKTVSKDSRLLA